MLQPLLERNSSGKSYPERGVCAGEYPELRFRPALLDQREFAPYVGSRGEEIKEKKKEKKKEKRVATNRGRSPTSPEAAGETRAERDSSLDCACGSKPYTCGVHDMKRLCSKFLRLPS